MTLGPSKNIRCVAHRGDSKNCPENTRASFISAIASGAHAIELDIQMSSDNRVFVFHDNDFSRMNIPSSPNYETHYDEISKRDIGSWFSPRFYEERTVLAEELFNSFIHEIPLLIEIKTWLPFNKHRDYYSKMLQLIACLADKTGTWKRFEILCYEKEILLAAKETDRRFRCVLNTDNSLDKKTLFQMRNADISVISVFIETLDEEFSSNIKIAGFPLYVFTCNNEEQVDKGIELGAESIMSDDPSWLKNLIGGK